jgi:hypothetical protein
MEPESQEDRSTIEDRFAEQDIRRFSGPAGRVRRPRDVLQGLPRHGWQLGNIHLWRK